MNMRIDPNFARTPLPLAAEMRLSEEAVRPDRDQPGKTSWLRRAVWGGRLDDAKRSPRYAVVALLGVLALWAPVILYLTTSPLRYTSDLTLILPGAGAASSVNLSDIGQASSSAKSAYSSPSVSPTATYKRLLGANRVLTDAARQSATTLQEFGRPRIRLIDETSLIHLQMTGATARQAQSRAAAVLTSFMSELNRLRLDEINRRSASARAPIAEYEQSVKSIRTRISALQARSGLVSVDHYNQIVSDVAQLEAHVRDTGARLDQARDEVSALQDALAVDPETAGLNLRLHADTEFQELSASAAAHGAVFAEASGKYGRRHPEVVAARQAYAGARQRLYARAEVVTGVNRQQLDARFDMSPTGERGRLLAELVRASARRDGLEGELAVLAVGLEQRRAEVDGLMAASSELDDLNRDYQVAEAVFTSALARTDTTKSDIYASYPLVQVLEDASLPTEPSSPKRKLAIIAGIAATFLLFIALVLGWLRGAIISLLVRAGPGQ